MGVLFQYARELRHDECNECGEKIRVGALVSFYQQQKWHHYDCFWKQRAVDEFRKSDIMILLKRRPINNGRRTVSLKEYDKDPDGYQLEITLAELAKIREQFALAKEHKTQYFIPSVLRTNDVNCAAEKCYFRSGRGSGAGKEFGLSFQNRDYHPECLLKTGKVNCDSNEIDGYDSLSDDKKKLLDELYKKDNGSYLLPKAETTSFEKYFCAAQECPNSILKSKYKIIGPRIRYQTKTYHPGCLAAMGKVNIDGVEVKNYDSLSDYQKGRLRIFFQKSNEFHIPLIEKATDDNYCTLADCPNANGQPSKFPWPYTIKFGQLRIKFHGDIYHPSCFKSAKKSEMKIKDFLGYDSLSRSTKQMLEENFEDIELDTEESESSGDDGSDGSDFESDPMDDDNDVEGPPAKKSKMGPQMQDENVSNENIQNEFDNDQEPFDGTNVKEEMSEPIILQMNTLNESYNAGPQIVNHREEREGNQESGDRAADEVDDEDIKEIPEIKTEVEGVPEIVTLDDEVETNEVQPEIKQESVAESYYFYAPYGPFFTSTLGKFDIEHTNEVYGFYKEFKYTKIPTAATLCSTFPISSSTDSFFKCLSLYFTGKEENFFNIKMGIQAYFYKNSKSFGIIDGIDFSVLKKSSPEFQKLFGCNELTNVHFTFICAWIKCRFMIFSNGRLSGKYGNWNENHPIFLIEDNNGFYKPVLALN